MKNILVVDDSFEMCTITAMTLSDFGFSTQVAFSGHEAMELMEKSTFDLVITDLEMPNGNGLWLLKKAQDLKQVPQIIVASGNLTVQRDEILAHGAAEFIQKPYYLDPFLDLVSEILARGPQYL